MLSVVGITEIILPAVLVVGAFHTKLLRVVHHTDNLGIKLIDHTAIPCKEQIQPAEDQSTDHNTDDDLQCRINVSLTGLVAKIFSHCLPSPHQVPL